MKKVLIYACMIFVPCVAFAATMCAKNNTLVIALDPAVAPSSYSGSGSAWTATFSSGVFKGVSTCVASKGGSMGSTTTGGVPLTAARGETSGQYCWCKLVHPVASRWVFNNDNGSASNCAGNCANNCGNNVQNNSSMRVGLFGSVSQ